MKILTFEEFYSAARTALDGGQKERGALLKGGLTTDHLVETAQRGREMTMLEIRCSYLHQLTALSSKVESADLRLAYTSAYTTPLHITMGQLRQSIQSELTFMVSHEKSLKSFLADRLLGEYGLMNTVAIKLQDPCATHLLPYREISNLGLSVQSGSSPIIVLTPTQQSYIRRDNRLVPIRDATTAEQLAMLSGNLPMENNVQYVMNRFFDVGQLRMSDHDRAMLFVADETKAIEYSELREFARQLRNESGSPLKLVEDPMRGLAVDSIYDAESNRIFIKGQLHESQKVGELIDRVSEAMVTMTSTAEPAVKRFEMKLLSVQLAAKWGRLPERPALAEVCDAFCAARQSDTPLSLEGITAKVNRATHYVFSGVEEIRAQSEELALEQTRQTEPKQQHGEELENFLQGIQ